MLIDLLEVARATGLRSYLHGVNATDARKVLGDFVAALEASPVSEDLRWCAWDADARTVTIAFDTEEQMVAFVQSHDHRHRSSGCLPEAGPACRVCGCTETQA